MTRKDLAKRLDEISEQLSEIQEDAERVESSLVEHTAIEFTSETDSILGLHYIYDVLKELEAVIEDVDSLSKDLD